jgi:hypothetical protein
MSSLLQLRTLLFGVSRNLYGTGMHTTTTQGQHTCTQGKHCRTAAGTKRAEHSQRMTVQSQQKQL